MANVLSPIILPPIASRGTTTVQDHVRAMDLWTRQCEQAVRKIESAINSGVAGGSVSISAVAPLHFNSTSGVLNISQADTSNDGYLSAFDWNVFNNKVPPSRLINTTSPLTGGGDLSADRTIAIPAADSTHDGYLTHTDWVAFNAAAVGSATDVLMVQVFS